MGIISVQIVVNMVKLDEIKWGVNGVKNRRGPGIDIKGTGASRKTGECSKGD